MAVKSSKTGKITVGASDFAEIRNWRFSKTSNNKTYATSSTSGHQKTTKGMFGGTVSFDAVLEPEDALEDRIKVGDQVTLELYYDATRKWQVPVRISSMDDECQIEEGEPPTIAVESDCHGAWTYPDGTESSG